MKLLFSCAGTSDPVRGLHDGPLLHIIRNYRPDVVNILLTKEIAQFEEKDHRFTEMIHFIQDNWEGYSPEVNLITVNELDDPSDIDLVYPVLSDNLNKVLESHPDDEILLNLSSGTPAVQIVLTNACLTSDRELTGVMVKTPERRSGLASRTNIREYNPKEELKNNQDETENSNRCFVPKIIQKS